MDKIFKHFKRKIKHLQKKKGFTLIEILVAITILATLTVGAIATLNPVGQINKSQDAVRLKDLQSLKLALDLYYNDKNCYPAQSSAFTTALNSGTQWKEGNTVYMSKVPKDPTQNPYSYITDQIICPQWATVFAKLSRSSNIASSCPLTLQSVCTPQGLDNTYACVTSGTPNCSVLASAKIGGQAPSPTSTSTPTSVPTSTSAPTPPPSDQNFSVAQPPGVNPQFYQGTISPLFQAVGQTQKISVSVAGITADVASVNVTVKSDTKIATYDATMTSGTPSNGTWVASWTVNDTTLNHLVFTLSGTDTSGNSSSFDISIR